jgi:hypothetical protein
MADRNPLGPVGENVKRNVKELRGTRQWQYKELSEKLDEIGRPIPPLGLRRIEAGERRVDADDLVALAVVFGVSPLTLLLPQNGSRYLATKLTPGSEPVANNIQWLWARGDEPLTISQGNSREDAWSSREEAWEEAELFRLRALPPIEPRTLAFSTDELKRMFGPDADLAAIARDLIRKQGVVTTSLQTD